jgi:hypothetical protein
MPLYGSLASLSRAHAWNGMTDLALQIVSRSQLAIHNLRQVICEGPLRAVQIPATVHNFSLHHRPRQCHAHLGMALRMS